MNKTESLTVDFVSILPTELSLHILSYLTPQELAISKRVSKNWVDLSNDLLLWKPFFLSIPGKIENIAQAKEYCNFHKKAKSKEELITKIRNFFEAFKNHREEVIGLHYQSASSLETSWFYFQHFASRIELSEPQNYFNSIHLKLSIVGYESADFGNQKEQSLFNSNVLPLPPIKNKFVSRITFNPRSFLSSVDIYWRNCEIKLIAEIAKECDLPL